MSKRKRTYPQVRCIKCGHEWEPHVENPERCPKCRATGWRSTASAPSVPAPEPKSVLEEKPAEASPAAPVLEEIAENPTPILELKKEAELPPAKERRKKERKEKVKKERIPAKISERHPGLYELAATMLPKSPMLLLLLGLAFSAISSMMIGNYLFVYDWYRGSIVLPWLASIWAYTGGPSQWLSDYWPLVALLSCLAASLIFVIWSLPWRFAFKDYIVIRGNTRSKDGRIMWSTDNMWTHMWDGIYGTPPRTTIELWLKHRFWWNPLMPSKGLVKLTLDREHEKPEHDGLFVYTAEERRYRKFTAYDEMVTTDDAQQSRPIPLAEINKTFASRSSALVKDTQKFSLANPAVRLDKLRDGTHIVPSDLKEAAEVARANRGEG